VLKIIGMIGLGTALAIPPIAAVAQTGYAQAAALPLPRPSTERGTTPTKVRKGPGLVLLMSVARGSEGIITRTIINDR
jgi:hypothetical protein